MATETFKGRISSYVSGYFADQYQITTFPIGADPSNTVQNAWFYGKGASAKNMVIYSFDTSAIPDDAEINSVSCLAGGWCQTSYFSYYRAQLMSWDTEKGSYGSLYADTPHTVTFDGGTWTRDELKGCRIKFHNNQTNSKTTRICGVTGAELTVVYTVNNEKFMLKLGGSWTDVARVFKKVNGIWVEQTELANVVDQTKRLVNGGQYVVELPEGYTRLEYIESTGSQYIDTNFIPDSNTRVVYDFEVAKEPSATLKIFAARTSSTYQFCFAVVPGSGYRTDYGGTRVSVPATVLGRHRVDKDKNVTTLDGAAFTNDAQVFSTGYSLILFGQNDSGTINELTTYRLYGCRIYDNGTLIRDMKPCFSPDATPGLYDIVNDVFYGSATTTDFASPGGTPEIAFSIAGVTYKGYMGMTFGEWVASSYNTAGYYFNSSGYLASSAGNNYVSEPGTKAEYVESTTEIVSGRAYQHIIVAD